MEQAAGFGRWVKQRRRALDLTQQDLAWQVGCSVETIRKIEANTRRPSRQIAERLAECLNLPPQERAAFLSFARCPSPSGALLPQLQPVPPSLWTLPAPLTPLIGRKQEIAAVCEQLSHDSVRLLTLTGPPGVGKTRLGLHVTSELVSAFADGACFVSLASVRDTERFIAAIAQALGIQEIGDQPLLNRLISALRERHLLLMLDNFEQLLPAAPLVTALLRAAPRLKALVTSRVALHCYGEYEYVVPPLELPDLRHLPPVADMSQYGAIALFVSRMQATRHNFRLTPANAQAIAKLCARLDGLPLAIELAAARGKHLTPQELLARLEQGLSSLTLLAHGPRDLPLRQQTLRNAIAWSYSLLDPSDQRLFALLGVFVGGCTLEAVAALCGDLAPDAPSSSLPVHIATSISDRLASLIDKSLLQQTISQDGEARFTLLETLRAYALEQLEDTGELETARQRHARFYLALAEEAEPALTGAEQHRWLERLAIEQDNLRAALRWAIEHQQQEIAARLAGALWRFWDTHGDLSEGRHWLEQALAGVHQNPVAPVLQVKLLKGAAVLALRQGDYHQASAWFEESLAICRMSGDRQMAARSLGNLGLVALYQREYARARQLFEDALVQFRQLEDTWSIATALCHLGILALEQGDSDSARTLLEQSIAAYQQLGQNGALGTRHYLGVVALEEGRYDEARTLFLEDLTQLGVAGMWEAIAECFQGLAELALHLDAPEQAATLLGAAEALRTTSGALPAPPFRSRYERIMAPGFTHLAPDAWQQAWARGKELSLKEAITFALTCFSP